MLTTNDSTQQARNPLHQLFDSLATLGYSDFALFEMTTPGATEALRTWAAARGLEVLDKSVSPPGAPAVLMIVVQAMRNGRHGCRMTVSRYPEAS